MASHKICFISLLVLGAAIVMLSPGDVEAAPLCPQYCLKVKYMTCPSSPDAKLRPRCNCCLAPRGCTLHLSDGTSRFCS